MAYGKKYTAYLEDADSNRITVNIYQQDYSGATYGIGDPNGLSLQIQGDQSGIYSPIIKTSVVFSMVDAWDKGDTDAIADGKKWGRWEEFYTNNPYKYKVELVSSERGTIWTGYVTPDSWGEDLKYRGTIRITARDMIGTLDQSEFDLAGTVTPRQLIREAWSVAGCPMPLTFNDSQCLKNTNGESILDAYFRASVYKDETWYSALEKTLESLGLCLRYDGANGFAVTSVRYAALIGQETGVNAHTIDFINNSGYRKIDPALKQITETFDVEFREFDTEDPDESLYTSTGETMTQKFDVVMASGTFAIECHIPKYQLALPESGKGWSGTLGCPLPGIYEPLASNCPVRGIYFPVEVTSGETATYSDPSISAPFKLAVNLDSTLISAYMNRTIAEDLYSLESVELRVMCTVNSQTNYLRADGSWQSTSQSIVQPSGESLNVPELSGATNFRVEIVKLYLGNLTYPKTSVQGIFAPLNVEIGSPDAVDIAQTYRTTTIYDEQNNVEIKRTPSIGSITTSLCPLFLNNILCYDNGAAEDEWKWAGGTTTSPLSVLIQAQILTLYAAPTTILTGTFHDRGSNMALPGTEYAYSDKKCSLLGGTFDFRTGFVSSSTIREYITWEEVWQGGFDPQYTRTSERGDGSVGRKVKDGLTGLTVMLVPNSIFFKYDDGGEIVPETISVEVVAQRGELKLPTKIGEIIGGITGKLTATVVDDETDHTTIDVTATSQWGGSTGRFIVPVEVEEIKFNLVLNYSTAGKPGKDGEDGEDGEDGQPGPQGLIGPAIRGPQDWNTLFPAGEQHSYRFSNGEPNEDYPDDVFWKDLVALKDENGVTNYYLCIKSYNATQSSSTPDIDTEHWAPADAQYQFIATQVLFAKYAKINFGTTNQLLLTNAQEQIVGGGQGVSNMNQFIWWAGADGIVTPINEAPWRVNGLGQVWMTAAHIQTGCVVGGFNIDGNILKNVSNNPLAQIIIEKTGGKFFRVNASGNMVEVRADGGTAVVAQGYGDNSTALKAIAQAGTNTKAIDSTGNVELTVRNNETAKINYINESKVENIVSSAGIRHIWKGTQAQYDAITTKDNSTLYIIV